MVANSHSWIVYALALVHAQHGRPGVAATTSPLKEKFHERGFTKLTRDRTLLCGCRCSNQRALSQIIFIYMLPALR